MLREVGKRMRPRACWSPGCRTTSATAPCRAPRCATRSSTSTRTCGGATSPARSDRSADGGTRRADAVARRVSSLAFPAMSGRDGLRIDVLGPLRVSVDGVPLELGGPLPRRLLAVLVAAAGRPVSDDLLTDLVWDGDAPARAIASVQAYVSGLRKVVGGREVLERSSAGYRLVLPPGTTDVDRFDAAVDRGRAHLAEGRAADAVVALEDALATWRGEPFAELEGSTWVRSDVSRLRELRTVAVEERLAARLASGDAVGAATELEGAVDDEPYRERRWSLLALALYRSGRQADALEALRRVRDLLAEELGVDPGEQLRALEGAVLTQDPVLLHAATVAVAPFSPAAADAAAPAKPQLGPRRVPRALSSFVGRAQERAELATALATHRVVTLVGPAGAGKTRLAIEHAGALAEQDGPWFVGLADVQDGAVVPVAVAEALGVAGAGEDPIASIVRALQGRSGLLVVDNCEHVIDAAATTVERLASAVPGLVVLATSREPLAVDGEAVLDVGSLAVDDEVGGDGPAIALFVDRVRQVRPGWSPDPTEKDAVRSVCSALDGIPLALELAAARSRVLSLGELATSLGDRFAVLPRVPRSSTSAHATLEAAIAWSFDLLGPAERDLVLRLWPFEGGFSLAAAESVTPHAHDVLNTLSSLVTRSVVRADTSVSPTRYSMLETIRAYSRGQSEDQDQDRAAQAAWIEQLVATVTGGLRGSRAGRLMRDLEREMPNVRAAFAYLMEVDPGPRARRRRRPGVVLLPSRPRDRGPPLAR